MTSFSYLIETIESYNYNNILVEARIDYVISNFGNKVLDKFEKNKTQEPISVLQAIENTTGDNSAIKVIIYISSFDPSTKQEFTQWMVIRYIKDQLKLEDLPKAQSYLEKFMQKRQNKELSPDQMDINKYQSISNLFQVVKSHDDKVATEDESEKAKAVSESKILLDDARYLVVIPLTEFASCFWGRGTEWCTTYGDPKGKYPDKKDNQFESYTQQGPLYIIKVKSTNERWQLQFDKNEYMNANDSSINIDDFLNSHKEIEQTLKDSMPQRKIIDLLTEIKPEAEETDRFGYARMFTWLKEPDKYIEFILDEGNPSILQYVTNPSEHIQEIAVKGSPYWALEFIKNPSENIRNLQSELT